MTDTQTNYGHKFVISKKLNLSPSEEVYALNMANNASIAPAVIINVARKERIPITGITFLGGNAYINVTGLDRKIKNKCEDEHLVLKEISVKLTQTANEDNNNTASAIGIVKFFDKIGFKEAFDKLDPKTINKELLDKLEEIYTQTYTDIGEASPNSCKGIAWSYKKTRGDKVKDQLLIENINMMGSRRATSRAKRLATGCGLTSLDELPIENNIVAGEIMGQRKINENQIQEINKLKLHKVIAKSEQKLIEKRLKAIITEADANIVISGIKDMISRRTAASK